MKKNRFIKLASGLLVLCLMTTCVIGATLAKYTTAGSGADTARVAKWGVRITAVANSAFATQYTKNDTRYAGDLSVKSSSTDKVVAPGTSGSATQFSISGTPEVAVRLSFALTDVKEVNLTAGTYTYTDGATVTLGSDYNPIKWTLKKNDTHVEGADTNVEGAVNLTLAEMARFLSTYHVDYAPGTDLSTTVPTYTLSWEWDFEKNVASMTGTDEEKAAAKAEQDKLDTLLGDLMAGNVYTGAKALVVSTDGGDTYKAAKVGTNYNLNVKLDIKITATQID